MLFKIIGIILILVSAFFLFNYLIEYDQKIKKEKYEWYLSKLKKYGIEEKDIEILLQSSYDRESFVYLKNKKLFYFLEKDEEITFEEIEIHNIKKIHIYQGREYGTITDPVINVRERRLYGREVRQEFAILSITVQDITRSFYVTDQIGDAIWLKNILEKQINEINNV